MSHQESCLTDVFSGGAKFDAVAMENKSSFNHIPMDVALSRVENGTQLMSEICKIFQSRLELEDREIGFSIRVSRPNLYEMEIPSSTSEKALGYLKNYYLFVSREQASYRRTLDEDLISELESCRIKRLNHVTEHKNNILAGTEDAAEASANLMKAKQHYIKGLGEVEAVRQKLSVATANLHAIKNMTDEERKKKKEEENKYSMGRLFSAFERSPEDEVKHQTKKLKKLESDMVIRKQDIEEKKAILLSKIQKKESFLTQASVAFEKAERDRLRQTEKALRQYCTIEKQALEARLRLLKSFEEGAVAQLNSASDIELFAAKNRDVDNTRMYSIALKMMEWDYKNRVQTGDTNTNNDMGLSGSILNTSSENKISVWADVGGDSDMQTEMQCLHHDTSCILEANNKLEDDFAVEEEVARIIDAHYDEKPSLEYLFSKLKKNVDDAEGSKESSNNREDINVNESNSTKGTPQAVSDTDKENEEAGNENLADASSNDEDVSEEETRALLCVSVLNDDIFATTSISDSGESEVSADIKRRIYCLSTAAFSVERGRHAFLQILDEKRGRFSTLDNFTFEYMKIAMKIFLDKCIEPRSVKSALRLANMSITFHKLIPEKEESGSDTELRKHYIQREVEINQHELWHMVGFWDEALSNGLREQLTMMDPVEWDELPPDVLTEKVVAIHNILFGQLGTLAFTMHEMGLEKEYVQGLVMHMGKASQLGDDLLRELYKSIELSFKSKMLDGVSVVSQELQKDKSGEGLTDDKTTHVKNEFFIDPHEHGMLDKSYETDVKELL